MYSLCWCLGLYAVYGCVCGPECRRKKTGSAGKALLYGILSSLVVGLFMAYLSFFHGSALSTLFVKENDTAVIMAASDYLRAYSIDCILTSFYFASSAILTAGETLLL